MVWSHSRDAEMIILVTRLRLRSSPLRTREYAIELCGKEKLLPPKWNLHVDEAPQEDGRVIWRCHLRGPKKDNVVTDDVIIDFVVDKSKVYAKWREMAKTTPEYSNQVCNSLLAIWHKKLGKEKGATISLVRLSRPRSL